MKKIFGKTRLFFAPFKKAASLAVALCLLPHAGHAQFLVTAAAQQQAASAGAVNRDIQKAIPGLGQYNFGTTTTETDAATSAKKHTRFIQDPTRDLPEEEMLASPIVRIMLSATTLKPEIDAILKDKAFNHRKIGTRDLERVRQQIWKMGVEHRRLLHVHFRVVPEPMVIAKSWLIVEVQEISIRNVDVVAMEPMRQAVVDDIQQEATLEFRQDKILDLDELDRTIQSRLRLGDVLLHSSVEPVDETHVDIKIEVKPMPAQPIGGIVQVDNDGGWAFGRDRILGTVSAYGLAYAGDKLDLLAMKTADVGNGDYTDGTYYARAEYQVPVGEWGLRTDSWASGLHYHSVKATPSDSFANGEAIEVGQGVIRPMYTSKTSIFDMRADYFFKYTVDRVLETERIDEKNENNLRLKAMVTQALGGTQMLQANLALTEGDISLAGDKDAFEQDQLGPHVQGLFTKLEEDTQWTGKLTDDEKMDFRIGTQGQYGANNLDAMEQFALGGATGLRAFGSGEAFGDSGFTISGDLGYFIGWGLHPYLLYDLGQIWKTTNPWTGQPSPNSYFLQDIGFGISAFYDPIDLSLVFAHELGHNPGLSAQGLDIDNTSQRYRVWSSMTYHY